MWGVLGVHSLTGEGDEHTVYMARRVSKCAGRHTMCDDCACEGSASSADGGFGWLLRCIVGMRLRGHWHNFHVVEDHDWERETAKERSRSCGVPTRCLRRVVARAQQIVRTKAESQRIVATRPLCRVQYPVPYSSRLQGIHRPGSGNCDRARLRQEATVARGVPGPVEAFLPAWILT